MTHERILELAKESFKKWYYEHGANYNAGYIEPVWMAAYNLAHQDGQRAMRERAAKEIADRGSYWSMTIRSLEIE